MILTAAPKIELLNVDCNELMLKIPDNHFDLAIVDPPYGLDMAQELFKRGQACAANGYKEHLNKDWDKNIPDEDYFKELFRVSKNQIIFGANYFTKYLSTSSAWIVWNKIQRGFSFADGELAWTSFDRALKIFDYARGNDSGFAPKLKNHERAGINIHPTQKPAALYRWLLKHYAQPGNKILDTHCGGGSVLIAAYQMKFDLTATEIDVDYFNKSVERFKLFTSQTTIEFNEC